MRTLYCHVEEPSMEVALRILLPKVVHQRAEYEIINHGSKDQLLKKLPARLQGYRAMAKTMDLRILVLVDRDDDDCKILKARLEMIAKNNNLNTKTAPLPDGSFMVVNRIVVEELEAWFFGDIPALRAAYPRVPESLGSKKGYKDPDAISGGTWEALHRELKGYYPNWFPKLEVARAISPHMDLTSNRSTSFQAFRQGVEALLA